MLHALTKGPPLYQPVEGILETTLPGPVRLRKVDGSVAEFVFVEGFSHLVGPRGQYVHASEALVARPARVYFTPTPEGARMERLELLGAAQPDLETTVDALARAGESLDNDIVGGLYFRAEAELARLEGSTRQPYYNAKPHLSRALNQALGGHTAQAAETLRRGQAVARHLSDSDPPAAGQLAHSPAGDVCR